MGHDELFATDKPVLHDFAFDGNTAEVFDDMVTRSVPFYQEIQRMVCEMATEFAVPNTNLYDLGCSTGTTLLLLDKAVDPSVRFVGIDNSPDMLEKAQAKFVKHGLVRQHELRLADLNQEVPIENASVVTLVLTLQFVRPLYRARVIEAISRGLNKQGCLLLVEKVTTPDTTLNRLFIRHYYAMKRHNGYSDLEVSNKREALENVLIPYRVEENRELVLEGGFRSFEEFFRWYNFAAFVATK